MIFSFKCSECNEVHEGSPSFSFRAPAPYLEQSNDVQEAGELGSDLCKFRDEDGEHFFIRVVLEIPIQDVGEPFTWGVWVSLSEQNFERYIDTYDEPKLDDCYFGWLCNYLPYYESTYALKTNVRPQSGGLRPYIELQDHSHALEIDYHHGITAERAQEIAEYCMHDA